jgi:hypothetical protein
MNNLDKPIEKQGYERNNREDEEEWTRIPIPQSDDSDSTEEWLSDDVEEEEDDA